MLDKTSITNLEADPLKDGGTESMPSSRETDAQNRSWKGNTEVFIQLVDQNRLSGKGNTEVFIQLVDRPRLQMMMNDD